MPRRPSVTPAAMKAADQLLAKPRIEIARALIDARRSGYLLALTQIEQALYGGMDDVFAVLRTAHDAEP